MRARGVAIGEEFRGKGVRFVRVPTDWLTLGALISISRQGVPWTRDGYSMISFVLRLNSLK